MNKLEKDITEQLENDTDFEFSISDGELFKRASKTANNQQGVKDLAALGMASIWVVFASLFMQILQPIFKQMAKTPKTRTNSTLPEQGTK
ncbi:hypothetical protein J3L16_10955 [Alteromonas sp. 5E99-2]|uniref:hypothetical protein n=1 Tax=Alteromonas sp. 5E99-2 TaxID=2817683 RepID=UPI001A9993C9|nr:hypothetical protein [Alteromonas sp. 5E99-2]MBO1256203.1 hypothetical protein [Alteromonas sp. 5E99-2]